MNKKIVILPAALFVLAGAALFGTSQAYAQTQTGNPDSTIIQKLVQKFNLKEADVKEVFDAQRTERHAQMQARLEELTEAQKTAILAKHKEIQAQREANREQMQSMTPEERREAMEKQKTELEAWAKAQGIDQSVFPFTMKMKGGMHGGMRGFYAK